MGCHVEPKAKHLVFAREILRFAQNDTPHFICERALFIFYILYYKFLFRIVNLVASEKTLWRFAAGSKGLF